MYYSSYCNHSCIYAGVSYYNLLSSILFSLYLQSLSGAVQAVMVRALDILQLFVLHSFGSGNYLFLCGSSDMLSVVHPSECPSPERQTFLLVCWHYFLVYGCGSALVEVLEGYQRPDGSLLLW